MATKTYPFLFSIIFFLPHLHFCNGQNPVKAAYWFPGSGFQVSSINSTLFTHLFCAFADLDPNTYQVTISSSNSAMFSTFTSTVRQKNPSVNTLLSIGGGGDEKIRENFAAMASQPNNRKTFIDSCIKLARSNNFHGLDIDWEYPSKPTEMTNFGTLITELRSAIANEAITSGKNALLFTAAVFRSSNYYSLDYPLQAVSSSLDWINAMTYDFYGPGRTWFPNKTAPPAALYKSTENEISGDSGIQDWIRSGLSSKKIVIGLPFYGYAWRLLNPNEHGLFAPANGPAISEGGDVGYGKINSFISDNKATKVFDKSVVTDYCYAGTTWIGYDDTQSISTKVSYAKGKGLLGYFAWHVGADDNWGLSQTAFRAWEA